LERQKLKPGDTIVGPAIITEFSATTYLDAGWRAEPDEFGNLWLNRQV